MRPYCCWAFSYVQQLISDIQYLFCRTVLTGVFRILFDSRSISLVPFTNQVLELKTSHEMLQFVVISNRIKRGVQENG